MKWRRIGVPRPDQVVMVGLGTTRWAIGLIAWTTQPARQQVPLHQCHSTALTRTFLQALVLMVISPWWIVSVAITSKLCLQKTQTAEARSLNIFGLSQSLLLMLSLRARPLMTSIFLLLHITVVCWSARFWTCTITSLLSAIQELLCEVSWSRCFAVALSVCFSERHELQQFSMGLCLQCCQLLSGSV